MSTITVTPTRFRQHMHSALEEVKQGNEVIISGRDGIDITVNLKKKRGSKPDLMGALRPLPAGPNARAVFPTAAEAVAERYARREREGWSE
ncbi:hypothetical protein [Bifidobacterium gallicum]|uniref:Putative cell cycle protein MesJ n=1 Tax=Bifidobacterium gallicum DSM 20093 = LMG 11596 TaxID=561180 RepID=D1NW74_9BIFI|nr:hypothetical protein [Bifidobacterium gallicum]EFA22360.1 hypothetical protein BIFGAL_04121 [Bifidobacterium gallicum DSM 20093 = LMG 11596]KFI60071.1 putative cell cycle protein MesJ [Bifidobacterium gallicum DSM 20093 = LMG 11596]